MSGRVAELVDLLVDRRVLLDIGVGAGYVGLGLVVIIIAHEILDGIGGEKALELRVQLGRQGLVVGDDQGGTLDGLNNVSNGKCLPRPGDTEQYLVGEIRLYSLHQPGNGPWLVSPGRIFRYELKGLHQRLLSYQAGKAKLLVHKLILIFFVYLLVFYFPTLERYGKKLRGTTPWRPAAYVPKHS